MPQVGPTSPTYRPNPKDKDQSDIESQETNDTIPVHDDKKTKNVGNPLGAGQNMTQGNEGQITHHDDHYGHMMNELIGKKKDKQNR